MKTAFFRSDEAGLLLSSMTTQSLSKERTFAIDLFVLLNSLSICTAMKEMTYLMHMICMRH